jgi:3-phenylpropionate/trans-cinnamate dioxygenase ferredoxin subunit
MSDYVEVLKRDDLHNGEMRGVTVGGDELLLAKVNDRYYAASNLCPHLKAKLAHGTLNGTIVTCPRHGSQFDLKDGHVVRWTAWSGAKLALSKIFMAPRPLQTYPVKLEGDSVQVKL